MEEKELAQSRLADEFRGAEDATWKASDARLRYGTARRKPCATLLSRPLPESLTTILAEHTRVPLLSPFSRQDTVELGLCFLQPLPRPVVLKLQQALEQPRELAKQTTGSTQCF